MGVYFFLAFSIPYVKLIEFTGQSVKVFYKNLHTSLTPCFLLSFSPFLPPSLPPPHPPKVDLQKSLRSLEEKEKELRMSRASLREKEAELQVGHEESLPGPLHISC